jgi:hypothetical protein
MPGAARAVSSGVVPHALTPVVNGKFGQETFWSR